jgi:hypothetical protein
MLLLNYQTKLELSHGGEEAWWQNSHDLLFMTPRRPKILWAQGGEERGIRSMKKQKKQALQHLHQGWQVVHHTFSTQ